MAIDGEIDVGFSSITSLRNENDVRVVSSLPVWNLLVTYVSLSYVVFFGLAEGDFSAEFLCMVEL